MEDDREKSVNIDAANSKDKASSKGINSLSKDDMELIAGDVFTGTRGPIGTVTGDPPATNPPPVTVHPNPPTTHTSNPPSTSNPPGPESPPPPPPPPPQPPVFRRTGRTWCGPAASALTNALNMLYGGSSAARGVLDQAFTNNTSVNIIRIDTGDGGNADEYNPGNKAISWDPFSYASASNWSGSPIIALAHEMIHASNPSMPDSSVFALENTIASQLNASFGLSLNTNRTSEQADSYNNTDSITSTTVSIQRGDASCN